MWEGRRKENEAGKKGWSGEGVRHFFFPPAGKFYPITALGLWVSEVAGGGGWKKREKRDMEQVFPPPPSSPPLLFFFSTPPKETKILSLVAKPRGEWDNRGRACERK